MTLTEAIDKYIESRESLNRSPTTMQDYRCIQENAFRDIMGMRLRDLDEVILQDAVNVESRRPSGRWKKTAVPITAKRLRSEWGLVSSVLRKYYHNIAKGTDIELPVLLAAWLSFSMSEILGLTKSKSVSGSYLTIREVVVTVDGKEVRKEIAKNETRNRRHRIPPYIMDLISKVPGDRLVPMNAGTLYHRWIRLQTENGMDPITFHDLRHLNASVMALLRIPDKYAQERGGWKTDTVMKKIYMQTFSEERERVDDVMDSYFEGAMQHEMQHEKRKAP